MSAHRQWLNAEIASEYKKLRDYRQKKLYCFSILFPLSRLPVLLILTGTLSFLLKGFWLRLLKTALED